MRVSFPIVNNSNCRIVFLYIYVQATIEREGEKNWGHRNDYKLKWQILGTQIRQRSEWKPLIKKDISITAIKSLDRQETQKERERESAR